MRYSLPKNLQPGNIFEAQAIDGRDLLRGQRLNPKVAYHRANVWWLIVPRGLAECCLGCLLMPCLGHWRQWSLPKP